MGIRVASRAQRQFPRITAPNDPEVEDPRDKALKEVVSNAIDPRSYGGVEKLIRIAKNAAVEKVTRALLNQFHTDNQT